MDVSNWYPKGGSLVYTYVVASVVAQFFDLAVLCPDAERGEEVGGAGELPVAEERGNGRVAL